MLCLTKGTWEDHLQKLEHVLLKIQTAGLKINAEKSFFGCAELEYLGYWITQEGIQPLPKKIQAIQTIAPPTDKCSLRSFLGMINYYRDMWYKCSEVLVPLSALSSKKVPWEWSDIHQKAFNDIKAVISKETLLAYPDFSKTFEIYPDASKIQLGVVISQNNHPIAFYYGN